MEGCLRRAGDDHGEREEVARGLLGGVGRGGSEGALLGEEASGAERSVHLVFGDLDQLLRRPLARRLEEDLGPADFRLVKTEGARTERSAWLSAAKCSTASIRSAGDLGHEFAARDVPSRTGSAAPSNPARLSALPA